MKELIERLEAATGPDRYSDALIECELAGGPDWPKLVADASWIFEAADNGKVAAYIKTSEKRSRPIPHKTYSAPAYTASIDAALTLVPVEQEPLGQWLTMILNRGYDNGKYLGGRAKVRIDHPISSGGGPYYEGVGWGIPIALCIAALRARAASALQGDKP